MYLEVRLETHRRQETLHSGHRWQEFRTIELRLRWQKKQESLKLNQVVL